MLLKPIITEKSMAQAKTGRFTFRVTRAMTKTQIKTEIESLFAVNVVSVRTLSLAANRFKAMVTLKKGQTIEYFELPKARKEPKKLKKLKKL